MVFANATIVGRVEKLERPMVSPLGDLAVPVHNQGNTAGTLDWGGLRHTVTVRWNCERVRTVTVFIIAGYLCDNQWIWHTWVIFWQMASTELMGQWWHCSRLQALFSGPCSIGTCPVFLVSYLQASTYSEVEKKSIWGLSVMLDRRSCRGGNNYESYSRKRRGCGLLT